MKKIDKTKIETLNYLSVRMSENINSIGETNFILLDIYETSSNYMIEAEIPGINVNEIEVYMTGKNLIIKGIKEDKIKSSGKLNFFCMERSFGPFKRIVEIPYPIVSNQISADYKNGLLTITLPKAIERRMERRKIKVNSA